MFCQAVKPCPDSLDFSPGYWLVMLRLTQSYVQETSDYRVSDAGQQTNRSGLIEDQSPGNDSAASEKIGQPLWSPGCGPIDLTVDSGAGPSEAMCIRLLRWAGREAPELLEVLVTAYMTANRQKLQIAWNGAGNTTGFECRARVAGGARTGNAPPAKLNEVEKLHIARVLSESGTLREAAVRLGINQTTLWRKRKRYSL